MLKLHIRFTLGGRPWRKTGDILTKILKEKSDSFSSFVCANFNISIKTSKFLQCPKLTDVTHFYKKGKNDQKKL